MGKPVSSVGVLVTILEEDEARSPRLGNKEIAHSTAGNNVLSLGFVSAALSISAFVPSASAAFAYYDFSTSDIHF